MSLVGNEIKKYRKELGLSQKELGARLDVSQAMIAQYENGSRLPKLSTMVRLASALNIDSHILTIAYQNDIGNLIKAKEQTTISPKPKELPSLAAYFTNDEYTTEELQKIKEYAEFIKSQRKN